MKSNRIVKNALSVLACSTLLATGAAADASNLTAHEFFELRSTIGGGDQLVNKTSHDIVVEAWDGTKFTNHTVQSNALFGLSTGSYRVLGSQDPEDAYIDLYVNTSTHAYTATSDYQNVDHFNINNDSSTNFADSTYPYPRSISRSYTITGDTIRGYWDDATDAGGNNSFTNGLSPDALDLDDPTL
jgi:hypothetical protein